MEILLLTSELAPYSRTSDVADVCRALARALHGLEHGVTIVSPLYRTVDPEAHSLARRLRSPRFVLGGCERECEIYDGRTAGGVNVLFVGNRELFGDCEPGANGGTEQNALRAALYSLAVSEIAGTREPEIDVVQAHDWFSALAIMRLRQVAPHRRSVLALQDPTRQGRLALEMAEVMDLDDELAESATRNGTLNLLAGGLLAADRVVTPAPSDVVAKGELDAELSGALESVGDKLVGIANAVDTSVWNPVTDVHVKARFDPRDLSGKRRCKAALQYELALPVRSSVPLFSYLGGTGEEQGGDLLPETARQLLRNDVQIAVVSDGENETVRELREAGAPFEDRMKVVVSEDEGLSHRIVSGSDFLLIPARRARQSVLQMCAHRYGTLPVARKTGALAETVVDCDGNLQTGTGFVFERDDAAELLAAARRAAAAYHKRDAFEALKQRVMQLDHSWERGARRYEHLYRKLIGG
jgi:starch synthase